MGQFDGKVVIITGAGRRRSIGRTTALGFAQQGADVVITGTGRDPSTFPSDEKEVRWRDVESVAEEIQELGRRALPLVVDVTNFTDKGWIANNSASRRIKGIPQSEQLHVVERFTRVDMETLVYEATVEDATTWIRPWTYAIPMRKTDAAVYEYACHEGNYGLENILAGVLREAEQVESKP